MHSMQDMRLSQRWCWRFISSGIWCHFEW